MKKRLTAAGVLLALGLCAGAALAGGGDAGDPLISRSYLEGTFSQTLDAAVDSRMEAAEAALRSDAEQRLKAMEAGLRSSAGQGGAGASATLKEGDVLTGSTGLALVPLAGDVVLSSGTAVDVTAGRETAAGQTLTGNHRYIVAEDGAASFAVGSPTAVISYEGGFALRPSDGVPDYYAIAKGLRELGLFRGSGSGIGEGFDLHLPPSRAEGLVMFIRILGEEADALACTGSHPFTDVPAWLDRYAAWAYQKGYANGVAPTLFGAGQTISAVEYEEFLLRALGYSVAGVQDYTTSLERALNCGALTNGEYERLKEGPFLRSHVAYVSYYTLNMLLSGSQQTLAQRLEERGVFTAGKLEDIQADVGSARIY